MYTATITLCIDKLSVVRQKFYEKFLINYDSMNRREICKLPGDCFLLLNKVRRKSFRRRQVKLEVVSTALVVNIHEEKFVFYRMKTHIFELKKLRCDDKSLCFTAYNFSSSYLNDTREREWDMMDLKSSQMISRLSFNNLTPCYELMYMADSIVVWTVWNVK